ncbi:MAG: hypothetical protein KatS3mg113_0589 [Planctomycetaceae bacterium]|nr:MAG: hypothetical protein KatS3mg113_0589 [Planctomycetaceae bacterium]
MSWLSRRLIDPVRNMWLVCQGWRDRRKLEYLGLLDESFHDSRHKAEQHLHAAYHEYVQKVSCADMAISWRIACWLFALVETTHPRKILDLGSGFSSFLLRYYASTAGHPCEVTSVDDDPHWLERTRNFLLMHGMSDTNLLVWDQFQQQLPEGEFDLVFHDLGNMTRRRQTLSLIWKCVSPSGILVLDDWHKHHYRKSAIKVLRQHKLPTYSARADTWDHGRFVGLALKAA